MSLTFNDMSMYPKEIIEATRIESEKQKLDDMERSVRGVYRFAYSETDKKYGETRYKRESFWYEVLYRNNYNLFFEKFPNKQEIMIGEQKFVI